MSAFCIGIQNTNNWGVWNEVDYSMPSYGYGLRLETKAIRCYRDSSVAALPKSVRVHPANHEGSAPDPWADNP